MIELERTVIALREELHACHDRSEHLDLENSILRGCPDTSQSFSIFALALHLPLLSQSTTLIMAIQVRQSPYPSGPGRLREDEVKREHIGASQKAADEDSERDAMSQH